MKNDNIKGLFFFGLILYGIYLGSRQSLQSPLIDGPAGNQHVIPDYPPTDVIDVPVQYVERYVTGPDGSLLRDEQGNLVVYNARI